MNDWSDKPLVIVASGPSLCDEDVNQVKASLAAGHIRVIVINDNWQLIRKADALYAADHNWWTTHYAKVAQYFHGQLWCCDDRITGHYPGVNLIRPVVGAGLPDTRDSVKVGSTSTAQALQLGYLWGVQRIALLGVDCKAPGGKKHWFGNHPPVLDERLPFDRWIEEFTILATQLANEGIHVVNCSRDTALQCFTLVSLKEFLK